MVAIHGLKFAFGASRACVFPVYPLLVVSYAPLVAAWHLLRTRGLPMQAAGLLCASGLGYAISSAGYYVFSGRFASLTWGEFGARMATYLPNALFAALTYGVVALVALRLRPSPLESG